MFEDTEKFADLPPAESTLLWAMRVWVVGLCRQQDLSARIGAALRAVGAGDALEPLGGFMWALSRGAARPIEVLCVCREDVSADERLLLDAFELLQDDEAGEAHARLEQLLSEQAATVALRSADRVAAILSAAGLTLSRVAITAAAHPARPATPTLH